MKKTIYSLPSATWLLLLLLSLGSPGIIPAAADLVITNHMMTRNPQWDSGCSVPIPADTFYPHDKEAVCWFSWNNASLGDAITCRWFDPAGELYTEQETSASYALGCWYSRILINDYAPANMPGEWRAEVYVRGDLKFTENFTIQGDTAPCPAELLYGEHAEETILLRNIRDSILSRTPEGRELITLYYQLGPALVQMLEDNEELKKAAKKLIDGVIGLGK